jgi:hypothetical protein
MKLARTKAHHKSVHRLGPNSFAVRVVWEFVETRVAADAAWLAPPASRGRGGAAGAGPAEPDGDGVERSSP